MEMRTRMPALSLAEASMLPAMEPGLPKARAVTMADRAVLTHALQRKSAPVSRRRRGSHRTKSWVTYG